MTIVISHFRHDVGLETIVDSKIIWDGVTLEETIICPKVRKFKYTDGIGYVCYAGPLVDAEYAFSYLYDMLIRNLLLENYSSSFKLREAIRKVVHEIKPSYYISIYGEDYNKNTTLEEFTPHILIGMFPYLIYIGFYGDTIEVDVRYVDDTSAEFDVITMGATKEFDVIYRTLHGTKYELSIETIVMDILAKKHTTIGGSIYKILTTSKDTIQCYRINSEKLVELVDLVEIVL